jgi:hypothetical protein
LYHIPGKAEISLLLLKFAKLKVLMLSQVVYNPESTLVELICLVGRLISKLHFTILYIVIQLLNAGNKA